MLVGLVSLLLCSFVQGGTLLEDLQRQGVRVWDEDLPSLARTNRPMDRDVQLRLQQARDEFTDKLASMIPKHLGTFPPRCPHAITGRKLPTPFPALLNQVLDSLSNYFDKIFEACEVTGGVVSLVYDQQILRVYSYGSTRRPDSAGHAPGNDTQFGIGSISKVFTDTMLLQLMEAGKVNLDDPVTKLAPEYNPQWPLQSPPTKVGATLRDLGSHLSGLPRYSPCTFGNCSILLKEAIARVNNYTLLFPPGKVLSYSNLGFAMLGRILERAAGTTWDEHLQNAIFKPLGMTRSLPSMPPPTKVEDTAFAYQGSEAIPLEDLGFSNPAGGVFSTAKDMAQLMKLLFRQDQAAGSSPDQILDGSTIRRWLESRVHNNPTVVPNNSVFFKSWGVPWEVMSANTNDSRFANISHFEMVTKDGSVPGYNAILSMQPQMKVGLFAAMSQGNSRQVPFAQDFVIESALNFALAMQLVLATLPEQLPVPPNPEDYVGTYLSTPYDRNITVEYTDGPRGHMLYLNGISRATPLGWLKDDVFEELPLPTDSCIAIQNGINYNLAFERSGGAITGFHLEGFQPYVLHFAKIA